MGYLSTLDTGFNVCLKSPQMRTELSLVVTATIGEAQSVNSTGSSIPVFTKRSSSSSTLTTCVSMHMLVTLPCKRAWQSDQHELTLCVPAASQGQYEITVSVSQGAGLQSCLANNVFLSNPVSVNVASFSLEDWDHFL